MLVSLGEHCVLMAASAAPVPQPSTPPGRLTRLGLGLLVISLAAAFAYFNRSEISPAGHAAAHARPLYLAFAAAGSIAYLAAYSGLLRASLAAVGYRVTWRRSLLVGPAIHFSNMAIVNSGGLGGMPVVVAEARRSGQPVPSAVLGYFITAQLGHLVFAMFLAVALVLAAAAGELSGAEVAAAAVFGCYTLASLGVMASAVRSERAFFWLHALPSRLWRALRRLLRRPAEAASHEDPRELYESIRAVSSRPRTFLWPVVYAALIEVIGVFTLWAALSAFTSSGGLLTPMLAYAAGVLFSAVGFLPAGLGFAEAGLALALGQSGVPTADVALVVVVYRIFEAWVPFIAGAVALHFLNAGQAVESPPRPGIAGGARRRMVAAGAAAIGLLNILLAARKHPLVRLGPLHERIPHAAVTSSRYALLAAGIALIASTPGLLHGKRQAWVISTVAIAAALLAHPFKRVDYVGIAANASLLGALLAFAPTFPARSDPARARQGLLWLLIGELGVLVYGVSGLYLLDRHFAGSTTFLDSLEDGIRLLFVLPSTTIEPVTRHGAWFIDSVRAAAIAVFLISAYHLLHPVVHRHTSGRDERARVTALLERYAANSIAYFHLLPDKSYFFPAVGEAFIGYRVVGHTAVALGEPIGEPGARRSVVREFAQFCDLNGWAFCFHQVTEPGAAELRESGLQALKLGEEAVIPVQEFALAGKSFKHLRNVVNRFERDGFTFEVLPAPIPDATLAELEEVSTAWLEDGGHRERAFTLGSFSRSYIRTCEIGVVRSPEGRIETFANLIPAYNATEGNFDMMRRRPDAEDGAMDYLFVGLIEHFRKQGHLGLNLGLAPLSNIDAGGFTGLALRQLYERGGRAFNFQGLRIYKDKWKPEWQPRYLCYRSEVQLPALAVAVARAGELSGQLPVRFPWAKSPRRPFIAPRTLAKT